MTLLKLQIQNATASRLDHLAKQRNVSPEEMAASAIEEFVEREEWQIKEIQSGLREADAGDFASPEEVAAVRAKYSGSKASD
jgi:predicted transcriptional regulator